MSKEEIFEVLVTCQGHKRKHESVVPVLDYIRSHKPAQYQRFEQLLNEVRLTLADEILHDRLERRQTLIDWNDAED